MLTFIGFFCVYLVGAVLAKAQQRMVNGMTCTAPEVLRFVRENDVKFIRLAFCDLFGTLKNISIMVDELPRAFEEGVSFDASAILGFSDVVRSDLFLIPDPSTLCVLPWRPSEGRVVRLFCDVRNPDGTMYPCDVRARLRGVERKLELAGYTPKFGTECEFYLFKTDENGDPTHIPHDRGGYFDIAPIDRGENIRREICLCLEQMGIRPETSHHEQGPGQNEIDFKYDDALPAADHFMTFRSVVKAIAARNGLYASFLPKPLPDCSGNGVHLNISVLKQGENIFSNSKNRCESEYFIAGVLSHVSEITAFLNPIENSYARLGAFEAPRYISWSHQNRSQLIRIPAASREKMRMELRSPDSAMNPYIGFTLLLAAGFEGIEKKTPLPPPTDRNLYTEAVDTLEALPETLGAALDAAERSAFVKNALGEELLCRYIRHKRAELARGGDYFALI